MYKAERREARTRVRIPCNECVFSVSDRTLSKYGAKNCVKQIKVKLLCKQLARLKMYPKEIDKK